MKIRNGFVSNSSSSSFILFKKYLTDEQIDHIRNWETYPLTDEYKKQLAEYAKKNRIVPHNEEAYEYNLETEQEDVIKVEPFDENDYAYYPEGWRVDETYSLFDFFTIIDNYDMEQFLEVIGIDIDKCGLRLAESGGHSSVIGLNDATTDIKDYLSDENFFMNYDDYWYASKYYKEQIYPLNLELKEKYPDSYQPDVVEPKVRKKWICEDAGKALNEFEHKFTDVLVKNRVYFYELENPKTEKDKIISEIYKVFNETKDNWKEVDDYE